MSLNKFYRRNAIKKVEVKEDKKKIDKIINVKKENKKKGE